MTALQNVVKEIGAKLRRMALNAPEKRAMVGACHDNVNWLSQSD